MSRLRLPLVVCVGCLSWAVLGAILGLIFRHALAGLIVGLIFGIVYVVIGVFASDKFPLDVWDAQLLESNTAPKLYEMLHELCDRADMDLPIVFSSPRLEPNAFVVSRRDGGPAIVINNGLTRYLDRDEVQAVMALMIARLATGAMPSWTVTTTLAGLPLHLGLLCRRRRGWEWLGAGLLSLFAYPSAALAWLGWNSGVITASDYHAAHLAEHPGTLETALAKIQKRIGEDLAGGGNPATAMLFAVPPIPASSTGAPFWRQALASFPYRNPDAAARITRLQNSPAASLHDPASLHIGEH